MINQKESKQVIVDSWSLKLLSRDMKTKTKNKDQLTTIAKQKKKTTKKKKNRKIKGMGNITPTMVHYSKNEQMVDTDP